MLEMSKLQETVSDQVERVVETREGSSTTEASSVLDKDDDDKQVEVVVTEEVAETDMTLTEDNVQKMESLNKEMTQESMNKSSTTPISIEEEEMVPDASSTLNDTEQDPIQAPSELSVVSELSYSDTFNNTEASPEHAETLLDNVSFPKFDTTTFHNDTFIEKSLEKSDDRPDEIPEDVISNMEAAEEDNKEGQDIPEEVNAAIHSATSSSSSMSSKVDAPSDSDEVLLMAAISTITVTPKVPACIEYKLPDIINEAEVLRRQQMQIEQEIEQLQQQVPFVYLRDIPNKPPPPYTLPPPLVIS